MGEKTESDHNRDLSRRNILLASTTFAAASAIASGGPVGVAQAQQQPAPPSGRKPNILVIFGDDIGQTNVSAYSFGLLGYKTPTIDRMAKEGMTSARTPGRSFPASPTQRFFPRPTLN